MYTIVWYVHTYFSLTITYVNLTLCGLHLSHYHH